MVIFPDKALGVIQCYDTSSATSEEKQATKEQQDDLHSYHTIRGMMSQSCEQ